MHYHPTSLFTLLRQSFARNRNSRSRHSFGGIRLGGAGFFSRLHFAVTYFCELLRDAFRPIAIRFGRHFFCVVTHRVPRILKTCHNQRRSQSSRKSRCAAFPNFVVLHIASSRRDFVARSAISSPATKHTGSLVHIINVGISFLNTVKGGGGCQRRRGA